NALDALALRPNDYYPMVSLLLQIFVTHPITSASAEPSSTVVKYLKSYFRSSMTEERLNRFAAMCTFILTFPLILTLYGSQSNKLKVYEKLQILIKLMIAGLAAPQLQCSQ
ncbi:conserved hypothetical protein, partial [Trichinella spiralis]|uniref:hypothetical protein n=1 Tax=Trichinella spiralis TaxID=6334 RepID=UPI0001EFD9B4